MFRVSIYIVCRPWN